MHKTKPLLRHAALDEKESSRQANRVREENTGKLTRRRFAGLTFGGAAALLSGVTSSRAAVQATEGNSMFKIGGEVLVNRLGFGAMRITGDGI